MSPRYPIAGIGRLAAGVLAAITVIALGTPAPARDAETINKLRSAQRYIAQGVPDMAAQLLEQIIQKHPEEFEASEIYLQVLISMDRLDEAEAFWEEAFPRIADPGGMYQARVGLRRAQGRTSEAFDDIIRVLVEDPERATWCFRETQALLDDGADPSRLERSAETARKAHPGEVPFTILSAVVLTDQGRLEDALRLMIDLDRKQGAEGETVLRFALEMQMMGKEDVALEGMLAAVERSTKVTKRSYILNQVADIQERQGKFSEALASLDLIAREREGTAAGANALLRTAEIQQTHLDDPRAALAVYTRIQDDPVLGHHRPRMLLQMADCYVRLGSFEEAAATYRAAIPEALDPEHVELASLRIAEVEFYRGRPDSALALYQEMAQTYPRSLFADQAADRYIMLNRYHQLDPEGVALWGRMEWGRHVGDSLEVANRAGELLDRDPESEFAAEALIALAGVYEAGGNLLGALEPLDRVVREHPEDRRAPAALMTQGRLLAQSLDRPQEALQKYETVLTDYPTSVEAGDARRLVEALRRDLKS